MGAEESKNQRRDAEHNGFTKSQVEMLLKQQKQMYDKKLNELLHKQNQKSAEMRISEDAIRAEAKKEVERVLREQFGQNVPSPQPSSIPSTSTTPTQAQVPFRSPTTYSYSQKDLQNFVATGTHTSSPTTQQTSLYPNISTPLASSPRVVQDPFESYVFVNKPDEAKRLQPTAPPASSRDRSTSRQRNRNNEADNEVKCPTCRNTYTLNIYQCSKGHSSCKTCKDNGRLCGICRDMITTMRNISLEIFIAEKKVKCPNTENGCSLWIKRCDVDTHLKVCIFRDMPCPLSDIFGLCLWKGKLTQMASHFDDVHQMHRQADVDKEMYLLNINNNVNIVHFIVIGTYNFLFHVKIQDDKLYMTTQALGTDNSARKWIYEIHIYNKSEPRRKYQYMDTCHSINIPVNEIITNARCAVIPLSYASLFINEDKLTYKFFIKKEFNNNEFPKNNRGQGARRRT